MNYLFLKNIMSSILTNFNCPECGQIPDENSLDVSAISEKEITIRFHCKNCSAKALMKAELGQLTSEFFASEAGKDFLKNAVSDKKMIISDPRNRQKKPSISPEEIKDIEEKLAKNSTINDLINGQ